MCKEVEPGFGLEENGEVTCHIGKACVKKKTSSRWQEKVRPVVEHLVPGCEEEPK